MIKFGVAASVLAVFLAGCVSADEDKRKVTRESVIADCEKDVRAWDIDLKAELSSLMKVGRDRVPGLYCERLYRAIASGRLTSKDVVALRRGDSTEYWRVLKGG